MTGRDSMESPPSGGGAGLPTARATRARRETRDARARSDDAMRELKHHERKLLKKVDFLAWKSERGHREVATMRRYHLRDRDEFKRYNKLCGSVTKLAAALKRLDARDETRTEVTEAMLRKLYDIGAIPSTKSRALCDRLSTSSFCRRRLATVLVRIRMCETLREATTFIEQGHVRVGVNVIRDPGYTPVPHRGYVTWKDRRERRGIRRQRRVGRLRSFGGTEMPTRGDEARARLRKIITLEEM